MDFSANINPLGPPKEIINQLSSQLDALQHYPEPYGISLKQIIAEHHGVLPEQVIVGNGASELIDLIILHRLVKSDNINEHLTALIPEPNFSEYKRGVQALRGKVNSFTTLSLNNDLSYMKTKMMEMRPQLLFLSSPNNPTGELINNYTLKNIVQSMEQWDGELILDYSFLPFVKSSWPKASLEEINFDQTFLLFSLTKMFALPGLRLGYGITSQEKIWQLEKLRNQWAVNSLAQTAFKECFSLQNYENKTRKLIHSERERLRAELEFLGFSTFKSSANFLLIKNNNFPGTVKNLWHHLACKGIFIRLCENFQGLDESYFRIAIRLPEENDRFLEELSSFTP
ncbi:pyridoxal phosphate-dependent aminotransferase [Natranaerobius thermophilus]|uniref:pyridoxal phosphate-dependent aminotransferase n=1 Tax=Natranaerobius thermophilus TaxID=375929 RepID=UPI002367891B|nr:histidinol-phosphate transaminase [Natranaerobius thermophilus]